MRNVFAVQMHSNGKVVDSAYRIFATSDAAKDFIDAYERYFESKGVRQTEGFDNVTFDYRTRLVYESPAGANALPPEFC